jgi:sugar phosphate isomerase/epimerase
MADLILVGYTYRGYPMAYAFDRAAEYGYHGVELRDFADIDLSTPSDAYDALERASKLAAAHELTIPAICYAPLPVVLDGKRTAEERAFGEVMSAMAEHGVGILNTRLVRRTEDNRAERSSIGAREGDYAAAAHVLERVALLAERYGVKIAIQTQTGTMHDTASALLRLLQSCSSPALSASLDFATMLINHPKEWLPEAIREFGPRIGYVHLQNLTFVPGGVDLSVPLRYGHINYHRVLHALSEVEYQGPLGVVHSGPGDPDVFAEEDGRYLAGLVERVDL